MNLKYCFTLCAALGLLAPGCRRGDDRGRGGPPEDERGEESGDEEDEEPLGKPGERDLEVDVLASNAVPTPFGQALDVDRDETVLLYPNLVAFGADPDALAALLPDALEGGRRRAQVIAGVQEGLDAAWVGAIGEYEGGGGSIWLMIQDHGWEPTTINPLVRSWARGDQDPLPDGRPVADVPPPDSEGVFFQTPASRDGRPRLVVHVTGPDGVDEDLLRRQLAAVPADRLAALEKERGTPKGAYPRSEKLPPAGELKRLLAPDRLAASLPAGAPGATLLAEGWGFRREASRTVVGAATRVFWAEGGVIVASVQDLGPPDAPVELVWDGSRARKGEGSAAEIRKGLKRLKKARCSDDFASCKWGVLVDDRFVLSVFGTSAVGADAITAIGESFDAARLR